MTRDVREVLARADKAWNIKTRSKARTDEVLGYTQPNRLGPEDGGSGAGGTNEYSFDSTPMNATFNFANRLQENVTPLYDKWFELVLGPFVEFDDGAEGQQERKQQLDLLSKISAKIHAIMTTPRFHVAAHECYQDLSVGRAGMLVRQSDDDIVEFIALNQSTFALEDGEGGNVEGIYRKQKYQPKQIQETWPKGDIPEGIEELMKDPEQWDAEVELDECCWYDRTINDDDKWRYQVIWRGDQEKGHSASLIFEQRSRHSPFITPRWYKTKGDPNGIGPADLALPDIRTLNAVVEMVLKNAAIALAGVYTVVDDGVINPDTVTIAPGVSIPVASNGGNMGASIQPLQTGRDFDVGQIVTDDLRQQIKRTLFDNQLPPDAGAVRSATEIVQRMKEMASAIGGPFGRLVSEFVIPLINRVLEVMINAGELDVDGDLSIDQLMVAVQIRSPLARTQDMAQIAATVEFLDLLTGLAGPEALLIFINNEIMIPRLAELMGVPAEFINSPEQMKEIQKQLAQMASQAANQNAQPPQGEVA